MNAAARRSTRVVVCLLLGRLAASLGLLVCLTHVLFHHPPLLWRGAAGTAVGAALLAEAASLVGDHRLFVDEIVRAAGLAALCVLSVVVLMYYHRVHRRVDVREKFAAAVCAVGFVSSLLWLVNRSEKSVQEQEHAEA